MHADDELHTRISRVPKKVFTYGNFQSSVASFAFAPGLTSVHDVTWFSFYSASSRRTLATRYFLCKKIGVAMKQSPNGRPHLHVVRLLVPHDAWPVLDDGSSGG